MLTENSPTLQDIIHFVDHCFNIAELKMICLTLGIDDEHLEGTTKPQFVISLLRHCDRMNQQADLMSAFRAERPSVSWPDTYKITRNIDSFPFGESVEDSVLPIVGPVTLEPGYIKMDIANPDSMKSLMENPVVACPLKWKAGFCVGLTNPSSLDMRIDYFYINVTDFETVDIFDIDRFFGGGGVIVRYYEGEIEPQLGKYTFSLSSKEFDYIKLSFGEMESFCLLLKASREGLYSLKVGVCFSIGSEKREIELSDKIFQIGFFDSNDHEVRNYAGFKF